MLRCAACPNKNNCVPPSGPDTRGGVLFIGEAPGKDENKSLIPFVGKTGEEVNRHYLPLAGLQRDDCDFTNAIKCWPVSTSGRLDMTSESDKALAMSCAQAHLFEEIAKLEPTLLVPMGAFACWVIDPTLNLDLHHGMPMSTALGIDSFPMFHPAGGIHEPKKMLQIRTDWIRLKRYLAGQILTVTDEYTDPDYREVEDANELFDLDPYRDMANDTEYSRRAGPFCLTYSQTPGTGRLIRWERTDLISAWQEVLNEWRGDIWFHNWPYDGKVVAEGGLVYPRKLIRDTMLRLAHLGNLPQALKIFAYRELGITMMDFEDLVSPYSRQQVLDYYYRASLEAWPKPDPFMYRDEKDGGKWKVKNPQSMSTKFKRFFTDLSKKPDKDVFEIWKGWEQEQIETKMGKWPGLDIEHAALANWEAVKNYACRDSDATIRAVPLIEAMIRQAHTGKAQEMWR